MIGALLAVVLSAAPAEQAGQARIEVDAGQRRYRAHIVARRALAIDAVMIREPRGGLAPGIAALFVRDAEGRQLGCSDHADGWRSSYLSSTLYPAGDRVAVAAGSAFATDWYGFGGLFAGLRHCSGARDPTKWASFRIRVTFHTDQGRFAAESEWMPVPEAYKQ